MGTPERMQAVARLISQESEAKIVVLSAVSGTTNTLVNIALALSRKNQQEADALIEKLFQ